MRYERQSVAGGPVIPAALVAEHLRVDGELVEEAARYAEVAARELEDYTDLALLRQTIVATTGDWPGQCIELPVGPAYPGGAVAVEVIEPDGTATPVLTGWWLEGGRYPVLHFHSVPGGRLRISYPAGYGAEDIPTELAHAIADHAARLFDMRGGDMKPGLSPHAARIAARYRRVKI